MGDTTGRPDDDEINQSLLKNLLPPLLLALAFSLLFVRTLCSAPAPSERPQRRPAADPMAEMYGADLILEWTTPHHTYAVSVLPGGDGWAFNSAGHRQWVWDWSTGGGVLTVEERAVNSPSATPLTWRMTKTRWGRWETADGRTVLRHAGRGERRID